MPHRTLSQKRAKNASSSYQQQQPQQENNERAKTLKSSLFLLDDIINKEKQGYSDPVIDNKLTESEVPLYICPPPPPMDDHSPTEETRLLLHTTMMVGITSRQPGNTISKGNNLAS